MDIEAFAQPRAALWQRLGALTKRRRLTGAEADELARLYARTGTHLSQVRSAAPDPALVSQLSGQVAAAGARLTGAREGFLHTLRAFFEFRLPAALYRLRWWAVGAAVLTVVVAVATGLHIQDTPALRASLVARANASGYQSDFFTYYTEDPNAVFAAHVFTNNAWIALESFPMGVTFVGGLYTLVNNAINLGVSGAVMGANGQLQGFFTSILPHGMLELSCLFTAVAAGVNVFWTVLVPGRRKRTEALAQSGLTLVLGAVGAALSLGVSGLIEGFVTPRSWPAWVEIGIGAVACAAYWFYVFGAGRRARRLGVDALSGFGETYVPVSA
ncbi:MAG: stage II sporulation protein M [Bifidobacteriaceae bacterium]|nr:stage II sporulation protein M [Bifidobacteriaceae bacterium]